MLGGKRERKEGYMLAQNCDTQANVSGDCALEMLGLLASREGDAYAHCILRLCITTSQ